MEKSEELKKSTDLIERQAAIDAIYKLCDEAETDNPHIDAVENELENLPSTHCDNCPYPSQYVPQGDAVSRKAVLQRLTDISYNHCKTEGEAEVIGLAKTLVSVMPSAQQDGTDTNVGGMISRQAAIDTTWEEPTYIDPINVLTEVRDRIKALPFVQPEIVRCKKCKHYEWMGNRIPDEQTWHCCYWNADTGKDDYCSYAERRTDEQTKD